MIFKKHHKIIQLMIDNHLRMELSLIEKLRKISKSSFQTSKMENYWLPILFLILSTSTILCPWIIKTILTMMILSKILIIILLSLMSPQNKSSLRAFKNLRLKMRMSLIVWLTMMKLKSTLKLQFLVQTKMSISLISWCRTWLQRTQGKVANVPLDWSFKTKVRDGYEGYQFLKSMNF